MDTSFSLNYIESALRKGESEEQIRNKLRAQGVPEEQINDAFARLKDKHDFLASNVAKSADSADPSGNQPSQPQYEPAPRPAQTPPQQTPQPPLSSPPSSLYSSDTTEAVSSKVEPAPPASWREADVAARMKRAEGGKKSPLTVFLAIVILLFLGAAVAGYYYFDDIINIFSGTTSSPTQESPSAQPAAPSAGQPAAPSTSEEGQSPSITEPTSTPAQTADVSKIEQVNKIKESALSYFSANGVYPQTVEGASDDVFYCYRKNGSHFIAGAVLEDTSDPAVKEALADDLDGNYYCGDTVKNCTDPTYCVGP